MEKATPSSEPRGVRRRQLAALAAIACVPSWALAQAAPGKTDALVQVWKDPNCGCCKDWVVHLEGSGFRTQVSDTGNAAIRSRLGMPQKLGSCHTALVAGYVIEGHVPASEIQRLLKEKPQSLGLSVPRMPVGSPGMDGPEYGGRKDPYEVLLVAKDGSTTVFQSYT